MNKPKSSSGDMSCGADHHISGRKHLDRCLYVCTAESAKSR